MDAQLSETALVVCLCIIVVITIIIIIIIIIIELRLVLLTRKHDETTLNFPFGNCAFGGFRVREGRHSTFAPARHRGPASTIRDYPPPQPGAYEVAGVLGKTEPQRPPRAAAGQLAEANTLLVEACLRSSHCFQHV